MKKLILFYLILISQIIISQNRYSNSSTSTYKPLTFEEISRVPREMKNRYNQNQKYLYELKKWILELKPQIKEQSFLTRFDKEYDDLTKIEDGDLARATTYLKQTENAIREIISDYNTWIKKSNKEYENQSNKPQKEEPDNFAQAGIKYLQENKYALAIKNFSKHLEIYPKHTDVLFFRGWAKSSIGDYYGAINDYDKIIELNTDYPLKYTEISMVYNNKSYAFVKLKKYAKALPIVEIALKLDKSDWHYWDTRAEIYLNLGLYQKCISDLDKALKIKKNENSYFLRGLAYIRIGEKEKGCKDLSKSGEFGNEKAYEEINKNCN